MKKLIYALSAAACCSIATTACNTEFDDFDINTVEGIETLANSGDITESDFNTFVENAQSHILFYNGDFTTYYDNGVIRDEDYLLGSWDSPYLPIRQILFCPDRTGRVCFHYLDPMAHNGCLPPYNDVYIELEWSTNSKEKSIIFRDKKLQEEGCEFAVTSLTLKYYDKKNGIYILEGVLPTPKLNYKWLILGNLSEDSATAYAHYYEKYVYVETYRAINDAAIDEFYPDHKPSHY